MKQDAPRLLSTLLGVVLALMISELFNILKRFAGFYVRVWLFDSLSRLLQIQKDHPYYCGRSANRLCRKPGVGLGESSALVALALMELLCRKPGVGLGKSSALVALALMELLWRVAFVHGPHTALRSSMNVRRISADLENCLLADMCSYIELNLRFFGYS